MPDPQKLLSTLRRAIVAFRDTPGRQGHIVRLPDAEEVMVVGDLHGHVEHFRRVLIRADLAKNPSRHLVLQELIHGNFTYPDGEDKSHQLVDLLAALKCQYSDRIHFLLGNHELAQWQNKLIGKGDRDLNASFKDGVRTAYGAAADEIYETYLQLFAVSNLAIRTQNRVFISHSLPPQKYLDGFDANVLEQDNLPAESLSLRGTVHSLVWGRDTSQENVDAFLQLVDADWLITGHIPCDEGYAVPNTRQIILDAMGKSATYCLFPAQQPVTLDELVEKIGKC